MERSSTGSRALIISGILAILLAIAYTGWWISFAFGARAGVERWASERRAEGWQVAFDNIGLRGYPLILSLRLTNPRISRPDGLNWQGPDLIARVSPLRPDRVVVRGPGRHELALPGVGRFTLDTGEAEAVFDLTLGGRPDGGSLRLQSVAATTPAGDATLDSLDLEIETIPPPNSRNHEAIPSTLAFGTAIGNLVMPPQLKMPIGNRIGMATLRGRVRGQWEDGIAFNQALANWRDGGGVIELDQLLLRWDPLSLSASGTLALDHRLQPLVAISARATGFFETIDSLAAAKVMRTRDASVAKFLLGALAKQPADGGPAVLEMPLTIQDSTLYAGPAALARIPDLPWQAPPPAPIPSISYPPATRGK